MTAKRKTIGLTLALLGITVFSGQACPPDMESTLPPAGAPGAQGVPGEPAPPGQMGLPGTPGTDATVTAGDGVIVENGVVSLDATFTDGLYWKLGGNAGTVAGADVIGTADDQALELHVNGARALRLEPTASSPNLIGGFDGNVVTNGVVAATIAGGGPGDPNDPTTGNRVFSNFGTIGGGGNNKVGIDDGETRQQTFATVGGGFLNTASGSSSTVGGGRLNTASGNSSTVGGGVLNRPSGSLSTVGGGKDNTASGVTSTIGGGFNNTASGRRSTVGGGFDNGALADFATIGGGDRNDAEGDASTIAGGGLNSASGDRSTVGGGQNNTASGMRATVGGGVGNTASGPGATVGGGQSNNADGLRATVPGGFMNRAAGDFSFAAGRRAKANERGSFVWADSTNADHNSIGQDSFSVRASGGVRFDFGNSASRFFLLVPAGNALITTSTGATLSLGGTWNNASDVSLKENFIETDGREILEKLADLPIRMWNYKAEDAETRHLGPTAQDFASAFGLGGSDTTISTVDADGVALAAIQGLYQLVTERDAEIAALRKDRDAEIAELASRLERLEALMRHVTPTKSQS